METAGCPAHGDVFRNMRSLLPLLLLHAGLAASQMFVIVNDAMLNGHNCQFLRHRAVEIRSLPEHEYLVLEDCLYYYLDQRNANVTGERSLRSVPVRINQRMQLHIDAFVLRKVEVDPVLKNGVMFAYVDLRWKDFRLTWDASAQGTDTLRIRGQHDVWQPDLDSVDAVETNGYIFSRMENVVVRSNGTVTGRLELTITGARCQMDFVDYPADEHKCEMSIKDGEAAALMSLEPKQVDAVDVHEDYVDAVWQLSALGVRVRRLGDDETLHIKFWVKRENRVLRLSLYLPMIMSGTTFVLSGLFGTMRAQLCVKLFALLLQVLCLLMLADGTLLIGIGQTSTPTVHLFYNWTIGLTLASAVLTALLIGLSHRQPRLPVPHTIALAARSLNSHVFSLCLPRQSPEPAVDMQDKPIAAEEAAAREPWLALCHAMNCLANLLAVAVYFVVCCCLAAR